MRPPQPPCSTAGCPAVPLERSTTLGAHDGHPTGDLARGVGLRHAWKACRGQLPPGLLSVAGQDCVEPEVFV
jgi:hypothetical protein